MTDAAKQAGSTGQAMRDDPSYRDWQERQRADLRRRRERLTETTTFQDADDRTQALAVFVYDEETFEALLRRDPQAVKQAVEALEVEAVVSSAVVETDAAGGLKVERVTIAEPHEYLVTFVEGGVRYQAGRLYYWEHDGTENEYEARRTLGVLDCPVEVDCPTGRWRSRGAAAEALVREARIELRRRQQQD